MSNTIQLEFTVDRVESGTSTVYLLLNSKAKLIVDNLESLKKFHNGKRIKIGLPIDSKSAEK